MGRRTGLEQQILEKIGHEMLGCTSIFDDGWWKVGLLACVVGRLRW